MFIKLRNLLSSRLTIPVIVFILYFILNLGIHGPAYLSDEVAYLDKAATIAGSVVHLSTSWFGGYSLMISPAFMLSSNPSVEWVIVLGLNALMWAGSTALLQFVLRISTKATPRAVSCATIGAMAYPSWLSMSGYAFATSGFVLVFMATLAALLKSKLTQPAWLIISAVLAGYLCWIHPLGFLFVGLFIVVLILQTILRKKLVYLLAIVTSIVIGLGYLIIMEPLFNNLMRGSSTNDAHYLQTLTSVLRASLTIHSGAQFFILLIGALLSVAISTFGIVIYGSIPIIKQFFDRRKLLKTNLLDASLVVRLLSILLLMGALLLTALSFASGKQLRIDQWVYGRYTDMFLLPVIGFSLLAAWRFRQAAVTAAGVVVAGIILTMATNPHNTSFAYDNKVNIQSLWPMHLASIIHADYFWLWALLGAIGIVIAGCMGTIKRKRLLVLLLIPIAVAGVGNYVYHRKIIQEHSTVSSLYQVLKTTDSKTECIGFTPVPDSNERFNLYSYYLHGYNLRQMSFQQWQQAHCSGPYFTYTVPSVLPMNLRVTGVEASTKLFMISYVQPGSAITMPAVFQ